MSRLPNRDYAVISETKIVKYLLNDSHSSGRAKARFLKAFGFNAKDWRVLRDAILAHAEANEVTHSDRSAFGTRYEIDGPLLTPGGRAPIVRVVWFVEQQEDVPRLVTLVPRRIGTDDQ